MDQIQKYLIQTQRANAIGRVVQIGVSTPSENEADERFQDPATSRSPTCALERDLLFLAYCQASLSAPLPSRQYGVQARATSFTAMLALVGLREMVSNFS